MQINEFCFVLSVVVVVVVIVKSFFRLHLNSSARNGFANTRIINLRSLCAGAAKATGNLWIPFEIQHILSNRRQISINQLSFDRTIERAPWCVYKSIHRLADRICRVAQVIFAFVESSCASQQSSMYSRFHSNLFFSTIQKLWLLFIENAKAWWHEKMGGGINIE